MSKARASVLYLGDTSLDSAASYLGAVMKHFGIDFDYVGSAEPADRDLRDGQYRAIILSDYPAGNFKPGQMEGIAERVDRGTGLLMIGGWDSFQGVGGLYNGTLVEEILPVRISQSDDRVNYSFPCVVCKQAEHEILADLPFADPPCIGGYNRVAAKPEAELLLEAVRYRTRAQGPACSFVEEGRDVLLAVGRCGQGRTAAFASDAAPHWVGGFVDWGNKRVAVEIAGIEVEVGECYALFFNNLIRWTARL
jgi:uncharacterized membrane protein